MKVLVTGGAGFIGSHLVDALIRKGHQVRVLDNLQKRVHPKGKPQWLNPDAEFMLGDVSNKKMWQAALRKVDKVFHQAAYQDYMPDYSSFFNVNATSTALMYEVIAENNLNIQKVVVASSQAVYGEGQYICKTDGLVQPSTRSRSDLEKGRWEPVCPTCQSEVYPSALREAFANPYNTYALSKYSEELIAIRLGRLLDVPSTALRYSICQGPRQSVHNQYSGVCRIFALRLLNKQPPIVYEDGLQTRDFVHVADVVAANLLVMDEARSNYEVFNVGCGLSTSVLDYAHSMMKHFITGVHLEPSVPGEYRWGDNRHSVSSIEKLSALGWKPEKTLEDIFKDYKVWLESLGDLRGYFSDAEKQMKKAGIVRSVLRK